MINYYHTNSNIKITFLLLFILLVNKDFVNAQNEINVLNPDFVSPGLYGKVNLNPLQAQSSFYGGAILVITDENLTTIYGEARLDDDGSFRISNLPLNESIYCHIIFESWFSYTEKIVIKGWQEQYFFINLEEFSPNSVDDQLKISLINLLDIAGHFAEIILKNLEANSSEALIRTINYIRIIGEWNITTEIKNGTHKPKSKKTSIVFNKDGSVITKVLEKSFSAEWEMNIDRGIIFLAITSSNGIKKEIVFDILYNIDDGYVAEFYEKNKKSFFYSILNKLKD